MPLRVQEAGFVTKESLTAVLGHVTASKQISAKVTGKLSPLASVTRKHKIDTDTVGLIVV